MSVTAVTLSIKVPGSDQSHARTVERLFFLSGAASLIVEVVLAKMLGYILGITVHATAVVLAAFMAGLAVGSWGIGRLSSRVRNPILTYGALELIVGLYALAIPFLYPLIARTAPMYVAGQDLGPAGMAAYRYCVATIIVLLPATVMGGTLPLLAQALIRSQAVLEDQLARLYAINTLGATAGALITTYVTTYFIGLEGSLWVVALIDAGIFFWSFRIRLQIPRSSIGVGLSSWNVPVEGAGSRRAVLVIVFLTGLLTFGLENVWTHTLATVIGMSVYAFGAMLGVLLLGIGIGSSLLPRIRTKSRLGVPELCCALLCGAGIFVVAGVPLWEALPLAFPFIGYINPGFVTMEACRFLLCVVVIFSPSMCLGASFPLLLELYAPSNANIGRSIGAAYAWNTVGGIIGSLVTGFVLLGRVPAQWLLEIAGFGLVGCASIVTLSGMHVQRRWRRITYAAVATCGVLLLLIPAWNIERLNAGTWISYTRAAHGKMIDYREDASAGYVTVHEAGSGVEFLTNGKFDASSPSPPFQRNHILIPAMFSRHCDTALAIGIGGGSTLGVLRQIGCNDIDAVDLSSGMVELARKYSGRASAGAFESPSVHIHIADGRNFLVSTKKKYDLLDIEISAVWIASSGNLFNREFYELAKERLTSSGILSTYLQLKQLNHEDLLTVINTIRSVFPHVAYFNTGAQGHLIASRSELRASYQRIRDWNNDPKTAPALTHLPDHDLFTLLGAKLLFFESEFSTAFDIFNRFGFLRWYLTSTDLRPRVEYGAPRGIPNRFAYEANYFKFYSASEPNRIPPVDGIPSSADALAVAGAYHTMRAYNSGIHDYAAAILCYEGALKLREEPEWRSRLTRLRVKADPVTAATALGPGKL